jgi:hypothetical protein
MIVACSAPLRSFLLQALRRACDVELLPNPQISTLMPSTVENVCTVPQFTGLN